MDQVAEFIKMVYDNYENEEKLAEIKNQVRAFSAKFPLYADLLTEYQK